MKRDIRNELKDLWNNNAFGNLDDFDRDDLDGEADRLLAHWQSMGWARGVKAADVAEFLAEKIEADND